MRNGGKGNYGQDAMYDRSLKRKKRSSKPRGLGVKEN